MNQKENLDQEIEILKKRVEIISNSLFHIFINLRANASKQDLPENIAIAQCMLQIVLCKMKSILLLSTGTSIVPQKESLKILDIPSMFAIKRSLFELVFMAHNIFAMTDNDNERQILLNLWKIRGFNNRQNIDGVSDELEKKRQDERQYIEELRQQILNTMSEMEISDKARKQIEECIKSENSMPKGYVFNKANGTIISFDGISFTKSPKELFQENEANKAIYPLLSLHVHPSYLGVLQFGQMFDGLHDKLQLRTILKGICLLSAFLIDDFNKCINGTKLCFDKLPEEYKKIISAYINSKNSPEESFV